MLNPLLLHAATRPPAVAYQLRVDLVNLCVVNTVCRVSCTPHLTDLYRRHRVLNAPVTLYLLKICNIIVVSVVTTNLVHNTYNHQVNAIQKVIY